MLATDDIVLTDGNREGFETILTSTQEHKYPVTAFIYGPVGCGKSTVALARGNEKDLLSTKKALASHANEILMRIEMESDDDFLDKVGTVDVLLLDDAESFFTHGEFGQEVLRLLVKTRREQKLDTIIISDHEPEAYKKVKWESFLPGYKFIAVEPLDRAGRVQLAAKLQAKIRGNNADAPELDANALDFLANGFVKSIDEIENALRYLITVVDFGAGAKVSASQAQQALQ